jgi:hypothetical protein
MFALRQVDKPRIGDRLLIGDPDEPLILEPRIVIDSQTWAGSITVAPESPAIDARLLLWPPDADFGPACRRLSGCNRNCVGTVVYNSRL